MKYGVPALADSPLAYVRAIFHPFVLLGISLLILWTLTRMAFLSWADLSFVAPVTAVGYVLSALAGMVFLGEHISGRRWAGVLLIVAGTFLVSRTTPRTTAPAEGRAQ